MRQLSLIATLGLALLAGTASASSLVASTDTLGTSLAKSSKGSSNASSSVGDDKVVLEAREDAAAFVGSNGSLRGAYLEAALQHIRQQIPGLHATDMQLAEAILAL